MGRPRMALNSRAMPTTESASGRFQVTSMSKTTSGFSSLATSRTRAPVGVSAGYSMMPALPSPMWSSFSEQHMPKLSTPRSLPFLIFSGLPFLSRNSGIGAPILAKAVLMPWRMFGAPQTTWKVSLPSVTLQTCRWSEFGCGSHSSTSATTMRSESGSPPTVSTVSTWRPARVSFSASSFGSRSSTLT